jgi:hypothetical protein
MKWTRIMGKERGVGMGSAVDLKRALSILTMACFKVQSRRKSR